LLYPCVVVVSELVAAAAGLADAFVQLRLSDVCTPHLAQLAELAVLWLLEPVDSESES
jgi:hypothetical protein